MRLGNKAKMEALMNYFPRDIANIICNIKDKREHADKLQPCLKKLQLKVFFLRYFQITECLDMQLEETGKKLKDEFPDFEACIELLNMCTCCRVHALNKPTCIRYLGSHEYRICCSPPKNSTCKNLCECPCRHIARQLVRAHTYTDLEYIEDKRHLLHVEYIDLVESITQMQYEMEKKRQDKEELLGKLNHPKVDVTLYTEYYNLIDEMVELGVQLVVTKTKKDECKFELQMHINDHPEIFTGADTVFVKYSAGR